MARSTFALLLLVAAACSGERAEPPHDTATRQAGAAVAAGEPGPCGVLAPIDTSRDTLAARVVPVVQGQRGMIARARWALSADRCAMVAVEDWASIENEPFADGVVLAHEGSGVLQKDGVWDAAPSPDWMRLAYGRAFRVSAGERDSLTTAQWDSLARAAGLPVADARRGAFPASGMAIMVGLAQPGVARLGCEGARDCDRTFPVAAGWRVAWSADGARLAAALPPAPMVSDDAEPTRWLALDPATGTPEGELPPGATLAPVKWVEGPTIDISVSPDTIHAARIPVDGGTVESADGVVRLGGRVVGPGIALAATRSGHYILALAPRTDAREYEATHRLVVYALDR